MNTNTRSGKYRPSSGTEGMWFMDNWCANCAAKNICRIIARTMAYDKDDPKYPKQWIYDNEGDPVCTSFAERGERKPYHCNKTLEMPL